MARKPKRSQRAYKEWAPSVTLLKQNIIIITHGKINGRATVNLKISISVYTYLYICISVDLSVREGDR